MLPGLLASYAAGCVISSGRGICEAQVERKLILGGGRRAPAMTLRANRACFEYTPVSSAESDFEGLGRALNQLRATLEAKVVHRLMLDGRPLVVVDGRLPPDVEGPVVGLIERLTSCRQSSRGTSMSSAACAPGERSPSSSAAAPTALTTTGSSACTRPAPTTSPSRGWR